MAVKVVEVNGNFLRIDIPDIITSEQVHLEYNSLVPVSGTHQGIVETTTLVSRFSTGIYTIFLTSVDHTKSEEFQVERHFVIRVTQPEQVNRSLDSFTRRERHEFFIARMVREATGLEMTIEWAIRPVENILLAPVLGYTPMDPSEASWSGRLISRSIYLHQMRIRFRESMLEHNVVYVERASFPDLL